MPGGALERFLIVQLSLNTVPLFVHATRRKHKPSMKALHQSVQGMLRPRNLSDSRLTFCAGGCIRFGHFGGEFFMQGFHDQRRSAARGTPAPKEAGGCGIVCTLENIFCVACVMWITWRKVGGFVAKGGGFCSATPIFGGFCSATFRPDTPFFLEMAGENRCFWGEHQ